MSILEVISVGPATSIQDFGRFGAQRFGLTTSGAMDRFSLAAANALVNQPLRAAAIEIGPLPARFTAKQGPIRLALYGALRQSDIGERSVSNGESFVLGAGEILTIPAARQGAFSYLSVEGGLPGEPVFGSVSVTARAGIGSPFARPLMAGDRIDVADARSDRGELLLRADPEEEGPIRVVLGPQDDYFAAAEIDRFLQSEYKIGASSDRMGYRLDGPRLAHEKGFNIVSDGIVNGHIQVPGNGLPLVLLADRGTTGGYPKIAAIITSDLGRFAQIQVGHPVRFKAVTIEEAQELLRKFDARLRDLPQLLQPLLGGQLSSEALLSVNLSSGFVHALDWLDQGA